MKKVTIALKDNNSLILDDVKEINDDRLALILTIKDSEGKDAEMSIANVLIKKYTVAVTKD